MKKNTTLKNNKTKDFKKKYVGLITEAVILFSLLYFLIISFIVPDLYIMVEILMGLLFLNLSYNNLYLDKKSKVGIAYAICGIIILVIAII